jgi:phytoene dehydrogenase-like protein
MLFKRKPKPPLAEAARLAERAVELVYLYWRDRRYRPSETDVKLFQDLEKTLFRSAATARRIAIRLERRFHGEPEIDERKF